jgi:hypothetical protein
VKWGRLFLPWLEVLKVFNIQGHCPGIEEEWHYDQSAKLPCHSAWNQAADRASRAYFVHSKYFLVSV